MDDLSLVGRTIGHHTVLEKLGEGGMGVVYKATDTRLGRLVALKLMRPEWMSNADRRRRFIREARTASSLNHPNILTIYEIDTDGGLDYIAMEYVSGGTLADLLASGPIPCERALQLAIQVSGALGAAHAAHIVHRDLKPSNIMLAEDGRVKVVDFGLAKLVEPISLSAETLDPLTAAGVVVGTAAYMSPEQAAGQTVDGRSDLFSLGTILYEMLSGRRPFVGRTGASTLAAVLRDTPAPLTNIPADVSRVVERCLRKDPAERFQCASELKSALEMPSEAPASCDRPCVAVLPFANMGGAKDDDYLCEGLSEEIIDALTRIPGMRVIARTSSFAVARLGLDIREVGARLGAGNVLEGSVRRSGSRVRVTAQLIDAGDGVHLWSERYDRELTDVLALEDEIAAAIAERLRVELAGEGAAGRRAAINPEAHAAYLEGRYYFARGTPDAMARAKACYDRALAIDPAFALAYDSLADLFWFLGFFGGIPPRHAFAQSTWYAMRALEQDDTLAETHALLGMLRKELDYNWPEVERELGRALELNRQSPLVRLRHALSSPLPHGRTDEAVAELELVIQADPLSLFSRWWLAIMVYLAGQTERMAEEGRHMIALDPNHFLGHWVLGIALDEMRATAEGVAELEQAHRLSGGMPFTLGFLAFAYGRAGRTADAKELLEQAMQMASATYVPPFAVAMAHIGLGEWDAALDWTDRAIEARDPLVMPIKTFPFLDPIRDDPRFHALLEKMNLA